MQSIKNRDRLPSHDWSSGDRSMNSHLPHRCDSPFGMPRRAATMLEVAVAMAICALLLAIVLPALAASRAAAHKVQCASQLKQIILACHAFEERQGTLTRALFHEELLPDLGYQENAKVVPLYACPADGEAIGEIANRRISYYANVGLQRLSGNGFLHASVKTKLALITDGASQTAAMAERLAWPDLAGQLLDWDQLQHLWKRRLRDTAVYHETLAGFADECEFRSLKPLTAWVHFSGYTHVLPPNRPSCVNHTIGNRPRAVTASSEHAQGVNVALADGAVRFIANAIDREVWWALATRNGNETDSLQ